MLRKIQSYDVCLGEGLVTPKDQSSERINCSGRNHEVDCARGGVLRVALKLGFRIDILAQVQEKHCGQLGVCMF